MNNLFKKIVLVFVLALSFFTVFDISKADACQILSSGTNFRPSGTLNDYDDDNRPWVYLDVKTQNCNTAPSNILEIRFFSEPIFPDPDHIQSVFVEVGQANTLLMQPGQVDFKTSASDFTIPILLGESGSGTASGFDFCRLNGTYNATCNIFVQFLNISSGGNPTPMYSLGQLGGPYPLSYETDGTAGTNWIIGCPSGIGAPPNVLLYGPPNKCAVDSGIIENVTTSGSESSGSTLTYSEEALAPLPGFSNAPDLGEFLQALFTILIVLAGLLALIMIIVGGVTYMTSDAFGKKQDGKSYIINAVIGLILALGAWVVLNTINPDLAEDLNINIPVVTLDGDGEFFSGQSISVGDGVGTSNILPTDIGLVCNQSGGSAAVPEIVNSFVNKVTYRWGAKGGPLPAGSNFPSSPNEPSSGYICTNDSGQQVPCRSFCPDESVCLDCSGFVNQVRKCAGLPYFSTGTHGMVANPSAVAVNMNQMASNGESINIEGQEYTFIPGDILVWKGHVVIYYGNGQIAESEGSTQGRNKNYNVRISSINKYKNRITHLIKVNP